MIQTARTIKGQMLCRNRQFTKQHQQVIFEFRNIYIRSEVLTTMVNKSCIFWDITTCIPLKINWRFGGKRRLNLRTSSIRYVLHAGFLLGSFLNPEDEMFFRGRFSTDYTALYPPWKYVAFQCPQQNRNCIIRFLNWFQFHGSKGNLENVETLSPPPRA
jgi:hypothetical protein